LIPDQYDSVFLKSNANPKKAIDVQKIETVEEMEEMIADDIEETKELEAEIDAELEETE
jgi:hypothetical protein